MSLPDAPPTTILRPEAPEPNADGFEPVEHAARDGVGVTLFTVLAWDDRAGTLQRIYSSHPIEYPPGGSKVMPRDAPWPRQVLVERRPYLGRTPADVAAVFADWPTIAALGCGATLNVPVVDHGRTLGALNLLHGEGAYDEESVAAALPLARLALPALRAWHAAHTDPTGTDRAGTDHTSGGAR